MPEPPKGKKRPRDTNQLGKLMVDILTGQVEDLKPTPAEQGKDPAAVARGKRGGSSADCKAIEPRSMLWDSRRMGSGR